MGYQYHQACLPNQIDFTVNGYRAVRGHDVLLAISTRPLPADKQYIQWEIIDGYGYDFFKRGIHYMSLIACIDSFLAKHGTKCDEFDWTIGDMWLALDEGRNDYPKCQDYVYFMGAGKYVKIGFSDNPYRRAAYLQIGCPERIHIITCIKGDKHIEATLHRRFKEYRVRSDGEWFYNSGALHDYIVQLPKDWR
ncbi:MAG: GIY-YIG nuclease family protein [Synergistaceae bacterium]|jgi:hypothetical protein|nr:GIY-YIG nuclease family protein [Synergistaceae bacterium]